MQVKVFTLPFNSGVGVFDDEEFNSFAKDKEIIGVNDYLFERNGTPYLTLVLKYKQSSSVQTLASSEKIREKSKGDEEWRKILDDDSMPLFNTLRQWRNEKSKKDGVPPYVILNNKQLAELCQKRPQSKYDLMKIDGIGKAKAERYGDEILKLTLYFKTPEKSDEHPKQ
ncbi:MAG: HRDC domain-containing protein [Bacteriovoracales bacterium]|nr:HRDC domain-containing protein [Bacteriovoracales bacterium]